MRPKRGVDPQGGQDPPIKLSPTGVGHMARALWPWVRLTHQVAGAVLRVLNPR